MNQQNAIMVSKTQELQEKERALQEVLE